MVRPAGAGDPAFRKLAKAQSQPFETAQRAIPTQKEIPPTAQTTTHNKVSGQAIESQLGIKDREITIQTQVSEGRVLGHVETSLGRSAIVYPGVALTAVPKMPGHELALGQVLGLGAQR